MVPKSPTDTDQPGIRLSRLIDQARDSGDRRGYVERRDRALADREFSPHRRRDRAWSENRPSSFGGRCLPRAAARRGAAPLSSAIFAA